MIFISERLLNLAKVSFVIAQLTVIFGERALDLSSAGLQDRPAVCSSITCQLWSPHRSAVLIPAGPLAHHLNTIIILPQVALDSMSKTSLWQQTDDCIFEQPRKQSKDMQQLFRADQQHVTERHEGTVTGSTSTHSVPARWSRS